MSASVILPLFYIQDPACRVRRKPTTRGTSHLRLLAQVRNEEDALEVCARLVRALNTTGENWSAPVKGKQDIDGYSTNPAGDKLQMQVVRRHLWREAIDRLVEIAMLGLERRDSLLDGFDIEVHVSRDYINSS